MPLNAQTFIDALGKLETGRDVEPLSSLFSSDAEISNPLIEQAGQDGAAAFWTTYRNSFDKIESQFSSIVQQDGKIMLEWKSSGQIKGADIVYEGVSVIEVADDKICAFRTYFDPNQLRHAL